MLKRLLTIYVAIIISIYATTPGSAFVGSDAHNWQKLYSSGKEALEHHSLNEADSRLRAALNAARNDLRKRVLTLILLEKVYEEQEDYIGQQDVLLTTVQLLRTSNQMPTLLGACYLKLAGVNFQLRNLEKAQIYANSAVKLFQSQRGTAPADLAVAFNNLAWIELCNGELEKSEKHLLQSLSIIERCVGKKDVLYGLTAFNLAKLYSMIGAWTNAGRYLKEALAAFDASLGKEHVLVDEVESLRKVIDSQKKNPQGDPEKNPPRRRSTPLLLGLTEACEMKA